MINPMNLVFSIIIPTYNIEDYILPCLESLKNQTLSQEFFEVVIVDDASTDQTLEHVKNFKYLKNRRIVELSVNDGPGIARNEGLKAARGEYVIFLDGDDLLEYNALEVLNKNIQNAPDAVVYDWAFLDDISKTPRKRDFPFITADKDKFIENYLGMSVSGEVIYTAAKREIFKKNNLSFPRGIHEDILVIFQILCLSSTIKKLTGEVLYLKNNRKGSIVNTLTLKHVDGYLGAWPDILELLIKQDASARDKYIGHYLKGINGLVYTLIYKAIYSIRDVEQRRKIYQHIYSVLRRDEYMNNIKFSDFPKQTKKDIVAHEYYHWMSLNNLDSPALLAFESKNFSTIPAEVTRS